jgi:putative iron-regulated protein
MKRTGTIAVALTLGLLGGAAQAQTRAQVVERYADVLLATYTDALAGAQALQTAIDDFVRAPSPQGLVAARNAWLASRPAYLETEMARFYDGPIDNAETGPEGFINAWPLDEAYIDYVVGGGAACAGDCDGADGVTINELILAVGIALGSSEVGACGAVDGNADGQVTIDELVAAVGNALEGCAPSRSDGGIINETTLYPTIDEDLLIALNEGESETTISSGYHAIEFLLWGQDLRADGPGERPYTDYVSGGSGTALNQARRGEYLKAAAALLVTHLTEVRDQWRADVAGNYRAELLSADVDEALRRMLTGIGTLSGGELTGERLAVAFETKDQEDEHSCFSDNTHIDHRHDQIGIQNAFLGRYSDTDGPGIDDLVQQVNPTLAAQTREAMTTARTRIEAIPTPFDQAILGADSSGGRMAIAAAIDALNAQTNLLAECAEALGISISTTP